MAIPKNPKISTARPILHSNSITGRLEFHHSKLRSIDLRKPGKIVYTPDHPAIDDLVFF
jgi:hypothetical protein